MDLTPAEKAEYVRQAANAEGPIAAAETADADAEQKRMDAEARAAQVVKNEASMKVAEAINKHAVDDGPPAAFVAAPDAQFDGTGVTKFGITNAAETFNITLSQTAAEIKDKGFDPKDAQSIAGWNGKMFKYSTGASVKRPSDETAVIYSDIEGAKDAKWTDHFSGADLDARTGEITVAATPTSAARFSSSVLPPVPTANSAFREIKTTDAAVNGTYFGVSGTYSCETETCMVRRTSTNSVTVTGGTLKFNPIADTPTAVAALMVKGVVPDTDYTHFGYWTMKTMQRDGSYTHDIETFFGGSNSTIATLTAVEGTAKYYGAAAGVYVKKDGADDTLVVTDGHFTADAMLTANFGGDKIAVDDQFMVSGTISGFMDGSMDLGFAPLMLEDSDNFTDTNRTGIPVGTFSGETNGGGTSGNWRGQFYGNAGAGTPSGTNLPNGKPGNSDDFPMDVAGEFNGHFVSGHVAGAFGAEKD